MAALTLKNLSKSFDNGAVGVRNLSMEILEGELMVLVGPSGSGKSTTLRLIAGLETPDEGQVFIGETLANNVPPRDRDVAMVFQDYALYPHLNVRHNLGFGLKMRGFPKKEIDSRVEEAAHVLGISELVKRKPKELSGGQRQRVALGRALVRDPKVFLFDEPLSNLDVSLRTQLRREIREIHHKLGATMVYVTHDQSEAMTLGQRVAVMNGGSIEQIGPPSELYRTPRSLFVATFLGSPSMNLVECTALATGEGVKVNINDLSFAVRSTNLEHLTTRPQKVVLGFRPEDMRLNELSKGDTLTGIARAVSVETSGADTLIFLETGAFNAVARVMGHAGINPGDEVRYGVQDARIHLFDARTEKRIHA